MQPQESDTVWCYSCGKLTDHEVTYRSDSEFTGKLLKCKRCGEKAKRALGGLLKWSG